ncbi:MAG: F0F1 ATP synthase subunit B, partial [Rhodoferax sp.]|nr:F0F1 ATP synthase subunit B [Rhodoferax sp.]
MKIDWWTLGLQAINVVVLVWLLSRFLFKPVAAIIAERQAAAARLLSEAQAARDAAQRERDAAGAETARMAAAREQA